MSSLRWISCVFRCLSLITAAFMVWYSVSTRAVMTVAFSVFRRSDCFWFCLLCRTAAEKFRLRCSASLVSYFIFVSPSVMRLSCVNSVASSMPRSISCQRLNSIMALSAFSSWALTLRSFSAARRSISAAYVASRLAASFSCNSISSTSSRSTFSLCSRAFSARVSSRRRCFSMRVAWRPRSMFSTFAAHSLRSSILRLRMPSRRCSSSSLSSAFTSFSFCRSSTSDISFSIPAPAVVVGS
mmetsp:Transcript_45044/g.80571  ORF Transcript_45044/g.80571 Transcript_45044/m.80571 type:complete len:241 (+) Transcript_45044:189-911(+)